MICGPPAQLQPVVLGEVQHGLQFPSFVVRQSAQGCVEAVSVLLGQDTQEQQHCRLGVWVERASEGRVPMPYCPRLAEPCLPPLSPALSYDLASPGGILSSGRIRLQMRKSSEATSTTYGKGPLN